MKGLRILTMFVFLVLAVGCSSEAPSTVATPVQPAAGSTDAPKAAASPAAATNAPVPERAPAPVAPKMVSVPAGTELTVILIDSLSSETNKAGDQFTASLGAPVMLDGKTVIAKGTKVQGRVVDAEGSGRVKGRANMRLVLTGIVDGAKTIPIVTKPFAVEAEGTKGRDAAVAGGGAGIGAAIGAATGGKKGAGLGAIIGGAAGAGTVLATKGKEVEFDSESKLKFTLDKSVDVPVTTKSTT